MKIGFPILLYLVGAPIVGGLLAGFDRKLTACLQGRAGPPLLQPFYDICKLFRKENSPICRSQDFCIWFFLMGIIFTGALFFSGGNLLLVAFAFTLGNIFFVLAEYGVGSPHSFIGAQRELIRIAACVPVIFFSAIGFYMVTRSFEINAILAFHKPIIVFLPGVFLSLVYIMDIKLHIQETVDGVTAGFSGKALAMIEAARWYETVILLGLVYLFCANKIVGGVLLSLAAFFTVVLVDNICARVKRQMVISLSWPVTFVLSVTNISVLFYLYK